MRFVCSNTKGYVPIPVPKRHEQSINKWFVHHLLHSKFILGIVHSCQCQCSASFVCGRSLYPRRQMFKEIVSTNAMDEICLKDIVLNNGIDQVK